MSAPVLPKLSRYTYKKDLPFREYSLIITPTGGEKNYSPGEVVSFRVALGNDRLRCIYGPQTYGTFNIIFSPTAAILGNSVYFDGSANSVFSRITTNCNGGQLEDFNKCNVYIPIVYDLTTSAATRSNFYSFFGNAENLIQGLKATTVVGAHTAAPDTVPPTTLQVNTAITSLETNINTLTLAMNKKLIQDVKYCRYGATLAELDVGIAPAVSTSKVFGFLLPSIIGSFSKKLFPVSEIAGANLDLDLQLDTIANAFVSTGALTSITLSRLRLNISVVEYNNTITEVIRRSYNNTYVIPCVSIQSYTNVFSTATAGNFTWSINATLMNAKGMMFVFRDADMQAFNLYSLSNRTSLAMSQAQLSIGSYTFPANRFLTFDNSAIQAAGTGVNPGYFGYANQVNYWMSAMKFFGQGIDRDAQCSTNRIQFNQCYGNTGALPCVDGTFVLAFNLEGLHENDDEFRSCMALDGNTTTLNFTTGLGLVLAGTTTVDCFILYEFDTVISQGTAIAVNKYNNFSNLQQQTK